MIQISGGKSALWWEQKRQMSGGKSDKLGGGKSDKGKWYIALLTLLKILLGTLVHAHTLYICSHILGSASCISRDLRKETF